eukprot:gnl/TRDRNA2_/TRDRNA2_177494_c1_seq5.p1 gnl/TRDRNA2_/TRDRNA2_177494_c1~~gnl/TRDRNA2_/TRDRNA2_177494_c1_seq5.p1  ORF type:complete len:364 (-),score=53.54 gnl/TRDRNA2_/TRDRNA2_177494_c1_seq5:149-1240(-)
MGNICCMAEPQTVPDFAFNPGPFTSDQVSHDKFPPKDLGDLQGRFGKNLGFTGVCQQGLPPWMWGISLSQLQDITKHKDFKSDMTMRQVTDAIIIPKTKKTGLGYALTVNREEPLRALVMVSHAWDESYLHFLDALQTGNSEGPFWVCATANYQPEDTPGMMVADQLGKDPNTGPFATVLLQASLMFAVNTPWCDIYTRMWCILEMYHARQNDVPVQVLYVSPKAEMYGGAGACAFSSSEREMLTNPFEGDNNHCAQLWYDCSKARCGNPKAPMNEDEKLIRKTIESLPGGFNDIDHAVEEVRYTSVQNVKEHALAAYNKSRITAKFNPAELYKWDEERARISEFYDNIGRKMKEASERGRAR